MKPISYEEQREMATHVQYEIDEFRGSFFALAEMGDKRPRPREWNRTVESVLFHFRALRDFFFVIESGNDDVFARHYVDTWARKSAEVKEGEANVFARTRVPINKRLAHITLKRRLDYRWTELNEMRDEMEKLIEEFKSKLTPERAAWFPRLQKPRGLVVHTTADNSTCTWQSFDAPYDVRFFRP
jgi:hypothetical protein